MDHFRVLFGIDKAGMYEHKEFDAYDADEVDAEIVKRNDNFAKLLVYYHSQLEDVLAEVRALDRVVADDLEAVMNQMWEAKDEVRK